MRSDAIYLATWKRANTGNARDGFLAGQIGNMDECVVEGSVDVGNTEHILAISNLWTEGNGGLFLWGFRLSWWLKKGRVSGQPATNHTRRHGSHVAQVTKAERTIFSG